MITILFGEMGVGKSYVGKQLAQDTEAIFIEGDELLPQHLKDKIAAGKPLNLSDVDDFVKNYLLPDLQALKGGNFVVAQALYRQEHRALLAKTLKNCNLVWVKTDFFTHIKRLLARPNPWGWVANMLISKPFFQKPGKEVETLNN